MRVALVKELGRPPEPTEIDDPAGEGDVVDMVAVSLNPIDLAVAAGRFYGGHPELPYVPGCEGVGRRDGTLVHLFGGGLGLRRDGTLAERVAAPEGTAVELPAGVDAAIASACGIAGLAAWVPVTRDADVAEGDRVLVLGATGTLGGIAVQAAKLRSAERVVAAGRNRERLERTRELGADETVVLEGDDLAARFKEACGGEGPTVVIDPLWGEPVAAAADAAAPRARIVHMGQSAGPTAAFTSAAVRSKELRIQGYSDFLLSYDERRRYYLELVDHAQAGRIAIDVERFPLDRVADAWEAQARGAKAVVELT
jgi:NADPH2:quinone reductase